MNKSLNELIELMNALRNSAEGCPWTKEQTFESLAPQTLEEAYELVEAIEQKNAMEIKNELADVLYHVIFYAQLAQEQKLFSLEDIAQTMLDKHQHRLPDSQTRQMLSAEEVNQYWEQRKTQARQNQTSILSGVSEKLPGLTRAVKLQNRAARVGFDWPDVSLVFAKISEEIAELQHEIDTGSAKEKIEDEFGDLLFCCANLGRHLKLDPETALRKTARKFINRFQYIEQALIQQNKKIAETPLEELEQLWQQAKENY